MNRFLYLSLTVATLGLVACSDSAIVNSGESSGELQSSEESSSVKQASSTKASSSEEETSTDSKSSSSKAPEVTDPEYWNDALDYGTLVDDRDGESYRTIEIGNQTWLAKNLRYTPKVGKSWCYDRMSGKCETYGRLYDWSAAGTACPEGWSLPDTTDWSALVKTAGGKVSAGAKLKAKTVLWGINKGTDAYGFSAIPGGIFDGDEYFDMGVTAIWWSATSANGTEAMSIDMLGTSAAVRTSKMLKAAGIGIRCILKTSSPKSSSALTSSSNAPTSSSNEPISDPVRYSSSLAPSSSSMERSSSSEAVSSSSYEPEFGIWINLDNLDTFKTVRIGNQVWFAENMNKQMSSYSHCYDQISENCDELGYLYSQSAFGVCPNGTHVPTNADWLELAQYNGGTLNTQGARLKIAGPSWVQKAGTDDYGFGAKPGGFLVGTTFSEIGQASYFWTSSAVGFDFLYVKISGDSDQMSILVPENGMSPYLSVRCIVDPFKSPNFPE